jgi:hypothetical protein
MVVSPHCLGQLRDLQHLEQQRYYSFIDVPSSCADFLIVSQGMTDRFKMNKNVGIKTFP